MDLRQLFATNLRRMRHARKLSQEALAHDAGIDRVYLSRVERAVTYVGLEIIEKLADVLEIDPAEFFKRAPRRDHTKKTARR
jgi:transcriptional regulator with XRE-family HTH domain